MQKFKYLLLFVSIIFIGNVLANAIKEHTISYKLFASGVEIGTENRNLTKHKDYYLYHSNAQTEGLVSLLQDYQILATSQFVLGDRLKSKKFISKEYKNKKLKKDIYLEFGENIVNKINNKIWKNNNCVDFSSMFLAISYDFKHNNPLNYCLADGKRIKQYSFENQGGKDLSIMGKNIKAIKLVAGDITVYLSDKYDYLPVLIQKKKYKYELKSISFK